MKKSLLLGGLAAIAIMAAAPVLPAATPFSVTAVQAQEAKVSINLFFTELGSQGVWVKHAKYRYVFCPKVDADWRPYTNGRWIYLRDRGWYFQSSEPFAWAVYHYGRWTHERRLGWCWVPGTHWAPAWVSWRRSKDYVGWAPLPPEQDGFQVEIKVNVKEPPEDDWVFVPVKRFVEPQLKVSVVLGSREPDVFRQTEYVGPVVIQNNVVINNNIDINFIQQQTNNQVVVVKAENTQDPKAATQAEPTGDTIQVFAPTIEQPTKEEAPKQAVEPEKAAEELGRPAEGAQPAPGTEQPATEPGAAPAQGEQPAQGAAPAQGEQPAQGAAPAQGEQPAQGTPATECPEGQHMVDGKCVPLTKGEQPPAPAEQQAPAPAEKPAPAPAEQPAPAEKAAPAEQPAAPAQKAAPAEKSAPATQQPAEPIKCPDGQELVDGKCVPMKKAPAEQPAPAEQQAPAADKAPAAEKAAPADQQAPATQEAAPAQEQAAPAKKGAEEPIKCPDGQVLVKGKCVPADQAPAQ